MRLTPTPLLLLLLAPAALAAEAVVEARPGPAPTAPEPGPPAPPDLAWPQPDVPTAGVAALAEAARTLDEAARELKALAPPGRARVKAAHDLVVLRLGYRPGAEGLAQDPATVFARRTANCEGYARLLQELGRRAGEELMYITGLALEEGAARPVWHAWNAARLEGRWELVDATFDDPRVVGAAPAITYRAAYLFVPPEVALLDHFPLEPRWQLLPAPRTKDAFLAPHAARATSVRLGVALRAPAPGPVPADAPLEVVVDNPRRRFVLVTLDGATCGLDDAAPVAVTCPSPGPGPHRLLVLTNENETGLYLSVLAATVEGR